MKQIIIIIIIKNTAPCSEIPDINKLIHTFNKTTNSGHNIIVTVSRPMSPNKTIPNTK